MAVRTDGPAPYAPASAVLTILERYRSRGLQTPFTNDVFMRAGITESLASRTILAFRLLDLIDDDGNPTEHLETLRRAPQDEYQDRFAEILRAAYEDVFAFVDPAEDDPQRVRDAFRTNTPHSMQPRMATLFLGLCEAAGIISEVPRIPRQESSQSRQRSTTTRTTTRTTPRTPSNQSRQGKHDPLSGDFHPAIVGLLKSLPQNGQGWTEHERQRFLSAFEAVLNLCIPIRPGNEMQPGEQGELGI